MKRSIFVIVIAIALLLSGCQNNSRSGSADFDDLSQFPAEKNAQNKYLMGATNFQEADGFFLGTVGFEDYLLYYNG